VYNKAYIVNCDAQQFEETRKKRKILIWRLMVGVFNLLATMNSEASVEKAAVS
jgi:hypothetical protein